MTTLRLITWNCRGGALNQRVAELAPHPPAVLFVQECSPDHALPVQGQFLTKSINAHKGIALGVLGADYTLTALTSPGEPGRAMIGATVAGPLSFTVLGIWSQKPRYPDDVIQTLEAYRDILRSGPAVVMGDFNSGTRLDGKASVSKAHARLLAAFADLELVSAYHEFHRVDHGQETHATYRHQSDPLQTWHIDFCFVPSDWVTHSMVVDIPAGSKWAARSDHFPLVVDLRFAG